VVAFLVLVAVTAVVEDPVEVGVEAKEPVETEAMVQQTAPRTSNYIKAQKHTAGLCGFDVSKVHGSTCSYKLQGHQDIGTGADTKGGSLKDKEFSKGTVT
jgi:hypothetical protein